MILKVVVTLLLEKIFIWFPAQLVADVGMSGTVIGNYMRSQPVGKD